MRTILLLVALLVSRTVWALPDVYVGGFGSSMYNGYYNQITTFAGKPVYFLYNWGPPHAFMYYTTSPAGWVISTSYPVDPRQYAAYTNSLGTPFAGGWTNLPGGVLPVGSVVMAANLTFGATNGWMTFAATNEVHVVGTTSTETVTWWKGFVLGATMALVGLVVKLMRHIARPGPDL